MEPRLKLVIRPMSVICWLKWIKPSLTPSVTMEMSSLATDLVVYVKSFIHSFIIHYNVHQQPNNRIQSYRPIDNIYTVGILKDYQATGTNGSPENLRSRTY